MHRTDSRLLLFFVAATLSCGTSKETPKSKEAEPAKQATNEGKSQPEQSPKMAVDKAENPPANDAEVDKADDLVPYLETELIASSENAKFLGWTKSGEYYAIERWDGELKEVYDALANKAVLRFGTLKEGPEQAEIYKAIRQEAKPKEEWAAWVKENPLEPVKSKLKDASTGWALTLKIDMDLAHQWMIISLKKNKRGGYEALWDMFNYNIPDGLDAGEVYAGVSMGGEKRPRYKLSSKKGSESWLALKHGTPWDTSHETWSGFDSDPKTTKSSFEMFWSPTGHRYVFFATHLAKTTYEDAKDKLWFIRTTGPQIVLHDAGIGEGKLRAKAATLAEAGFPVQGVTTHSGEVSESAVYYRGAAKAAAEKVAAEFGVTKVEKLKKPGWVHVIAILK